MVIGDRFAGFETGCIDALCNSSCVVGINPIG
jgi:hypothetical protein